MIVHVDLGSFWAFPWLIGLSNVWNVRPMLAKNFGFPG